MNVLLFYKEKIQMPRAKVKEFKCKECKAGPFQGEHGLRMHHIRKHGPHRKGWGSTKGRTKKTKITHGNTRQMLHEVLIQNDAAMRIEDLAKAMQNRGYRPKTPTRVIAGYIGQLASKDKDIKRMERGVYRMRKNARHQTPAKPETHEPPVPTVEGMPREALLVQLEVQTKISKALHEAHTVLLRNLNDV
jgi:hypothetical protein